MILSDKWILENNMSPNEAKNIITPFIPVKLKDGLSSGLSSYGYDLRCAPEFEVFKAAPTGTSPHQGTKALTIVDPKNFDARCLERINGDYCIIPPNSFCLTRTIEHIRMPKDCLAICIGKSTYARCGIIANTTPIEPGWEGHITIELSNTTQLPAKIYANEGIVQLLFLKGDQECRYPYGDGKYNGQIGITLPRS